MMDVADRTSGLSHVDIYSFPDERFEKPEPVSQEEALAALAEIKRQFMDYLGVPYLKECEVPTRRLEERLNNAMRNVQQKAEANQLEATQFAKVEETLAVAMTDPPHKLVEALRRISEKAELQRD
ncbi:MAG: hypothetical protein ACOYJ2_01770 [Rickettsiales bacterium]